MARGHFIDHAHPFRRPAIWVSANNSKQKNAQQRLVAIAVRFKFYSYFINLVAVFTEPGYFISGSSDKHPQNPNL